MKILVIDDNRMQRLILKRWLEPTYSVIEAQDAKEGYEKIAQEMPDCIILDFMMPRETGIVMLHELQKISGCPPIILMSQYLEESLKRNATALGAVACLEKNTDMKSLMKTIDSAIDHS